MYDSRLIPVGYGQPDYDGMIDISTITITGQAEPTSRCLDGSSDAGYAQEWVEPGQLPDGTTCSVVYLFDDEDVAAAGDDESSLPWDEDHIARVRLDG